MVDSKYDGHHAHARGEEQGEILLAGLIIAVENRLGHTLHVALIRLHQPAQILLRRVDHAVVSRMEVINKCIGESLAALGQLPVIHRAVAPRSVSSPSRCALSCGYWLKARAAPWTSMSLLNEQAWIQTTF